MRSESILRLVIVGISSALVVGAGVLGIRGAEGADKESGKTHHVSQTLKAFQSSKWQQADVWSGITVRDEAHALSMIRGRMRNCPPTGASAKETVLVEAVTGLKVPLSAIIRKGQPVALIFGSATSPTTRKNLVEVSRLQEKFGEAIDFYFVYLREARPTGGFQASSTGLFPKRGGTAIQLTDPVSQKGRNAAALKFADDVGLEMPVLVDTMDDVAAVRWSAWPSRVVVIDAQARVVFSGGQGPWFSQLEGQESEAGSVNVTVTVTETTTAAATVTVAAPEDIKALPREGQSLEAFLDGFVQTHPPRPLTFPEPQVPDAFSGKTITSLDMASRLIRKRIINAPRSGEKAPGFTLKEIASGNVVSLDEFHQDRPTVLIFGSYGCGVALEGLSGLLRVHERFKERANFVMIYIREAHSLDGFQPDEGRFPDPKTQPDRERAAQLCRSDLKLPFPVLADTVDDLVATRWGAWPSRIFVVEKGRLIYAGRQGPWGYRPVAEFQHKDHPLQTQDLFYTGESLESFLENYLGKPQ